ncbi:hypothetical protein AMECASPLE_039536 [Ameca splendens]|uniref:Uncharacterized protein n=1 Tax=Ameca splendens TaxID=208324 RepID=A0ABV0XLL3_9TELE
MTLQLITYRGLILAARRTVCCGLQDDILWPAGRYLVARRTISCGPQDDILWPAGRYLVARRTISCGHHRDMKARRGSGLLKEVLTFGARLSYTDFLHIPLVTTVWRMMNIPVAVTFFSGRHLGTFYHQQMP